jgi:hypothetical protein
MQFFIWSIKEFALIKKHFFKLTINLFNHCQKEQGNNFEEISPYGRSGIDIPYSG